jgi:hypothetical protein
MAQSSSRGALDLKAGELVEVLSQEEILRTLDDRGRLAAMPFMPEMLQYCGKRFRVHKRADKTCDNILPWNMRRVKDAVHLAGVRCDGKAHADCDAGCLIFWHEGWLKRVTATSPEVVRIAPHDPAGIGTDIKANRAGCTMQSLERAVSMKTEPVSGEPVYSSQATDLREFTSDLPWWNLLQYVRDIRSGNLRSGVAGDSRSESLLDTLLGCLEVLRSLLITTFNSFQALRNSVQYPHIEGTLATTPTEELHLKPGEFVHVRSKAEILATLDQRNRNRGLLFDSEMLRYCGGTYRVLKRVHQIVDEKTGKLLRMKSPCIILEGSACASEYHRLCPRGIYHYWREAWLRRVE